MADCKILTLKQAIEMTRYSLAWARLHCKDADFPQMFHVFDAKQKYLNCDEWIAYCKRHNIEIVRNV